MKNKVKIALHSAIAKLSDTGLIPPDINVEVHVERARDIKHGDYASNVAMMLSKQAQLKPRDLAEKIIAALPESDAFINWSIAGPGFINVFMSEVAKFGVVADVLTQTDKFGRCNIGNGKRVQIEFVSANPTGPLHVGHGRGAAYGSVLSNLLSITGYEVDNEYYVNDAGRQMDILATSVWLRYLELCDEQVPFPSNGYKGDYVFDIAATVHREKRNALQHAAKEILTDVPADADEQGNGDKEKHIDGLIEKAKSLLSTEDYRFVFDAALNTILDDIKKDLSAFGVEFKNWFSERSLFENGDVDKALDVLSGTGHLYEKEGNLWFKSTKYGDEKDRVVVRANGSKTYLASDIAYHLNKLNRGYDQIIDIWGADHHGYVARVKASIQAMGKQPETLEVLLVQFAVLFRGKEKVAMSTRSGQFVTLRELRNEVGKDAARFFYVMRKCEQHMDFDLELAKSKSNDNPVYYIQYAHARICSVWRQLSEKGFQYDQSQGLGNLAKLTESHEEQLMSSLWRYAEVIEIAARGHEPHHIAHYLRDLANDFHSYYNAHQFLIDDAGTRNARLALVNATKQVIVNGLTVLGVSAPEEM